VSIATQAGLLCFSLCLKLVAHMAAPKLTPAER
jgi:hypothetical protein